MSYLGSVVAIFGMGVVFLVLIVLFYTIHLLNLVVNAKSPSQEKGTTIISQDHIPHVIAAAVFTYLDSKR